MQPAQAYKAMIFNTAEKVYSLGSASLANTASAGICHGSLAHFPRSGGKFHDFPRPQQCPSLPMCWRLTRTWSRGDNAGGQKYQRMAKLIGLPYANTAVAVNSLIRRIREMEATFGILL